jgi:hypothetical protein
MFVNPPAKYPFTVKEARNPNLIQHLSNLYSLLKKILKENVKFSAGDEILLEDFGTCQEMCSYTNKDGYFIQYRIHPLYRSLIGNNKVDQKFENELEKYFSGNKPLKTEQNERVTLYFHTETISIGD